MTVTSEQKEPKEPEKKESGQAPEPAPSGGLFTPYRADQGRHARMAAFWLLMAFLLFGCTFLHDILVQWESLATPIGAVPPSETNPVGVKGIRIPVAGIDLTPAFLVCALVFCGGAFLIVRWQQRPKVADLLIDTEAELKKVNWPSGQEVWNASVVVIVSVILLGIFLALTDIFLFRLMKYVLRYS